ncbi:MAG TPA: hypothetical protein VGD78_01935 [Chthoniobacterales bacterium]
MPFRSSLVFAVLGLTGLTAYGDSQLPLSYVPRRVRAAIQGYVPGAELTKAEIANDDEWGTKYRCEYYRGGHKGKIQVSERGRLLDVDEDLDPRQLPPSVRRAAARESRGGVIRRAHLDEDRGRMVFSVESFYGMSSAKVKLKVRRDGTVIERDFD